MHNLNKGYLFLGRKPVLQIEPLQQTARLSVVQNNSLIISPALPTDQGWYICSAQNDGKCSVDKYIVYNWPCKYTVFSREIEYLYLNHYTKTAEN